MIITIVDTTKYGKFILHAHPYSSTSLPELPEKMSQGDLQEAMSDAFDYFGLYHRQKLIATSGQSLDENTVVDMFIANEKFSTVVIGIDDDCVLVSKSVFLHSSPAKIIPSLATSSTLSTASILATFQSQNAQIVDLSDHEDSIVSSLSLIYRQDSYANLEETKHKLSYLINILEQRQRNDLYLTRHIHAIMGQKSIIKKKIKDMCSVKDSSIYYEDSKIKAIVKELAGFAGKIREGNELFNFMRQIHENWNRKIKYSAAGKLAPYDLDIMADCRFVVPNDSVDSFNRQQQQLKHKTAVIIPPKLTQMLPPNLYPEQVKQFCDKVLTSNRANFEETITSKAINRKECYHTVHFLLLNHLAVEIYPINGSFAYNIFTLIDLPSWEFIDKFNVRIFPGSNFIKCANMYSNYKPFRDEDDCLKYLLVKEVIKEVKIYVYRKCFVESESGATGKNAETTTSMSLAGAAGVIGTNISKSIDNILQRSVNGHYDINEIVSRQAISMAELINFVKTHFRQWGFYFVE